MTCITPRRMRRLAALSLLLVPVGGFAQELCDGLEYGLALHVTESDYSGCNGVDDLDLACEEIDPAGTSGSQFVWIIAYGLDDVPSWPSGAIGGSVFAVRYPPSVTVTGWSLCTGGSMIPVDNPVDGTWPQSDTGIAVTWSGGSYDPPSGYAKVGFLVVHDGSVGPIQIAPHVSVEAVEITSSVPDIVTVDVPPAGWSIADVDGTTGTACASCIVPPLPVDDTTWSAVKAAFRR